MFKDKSEDFNENQEKFRSLDRKAKDGGELEAQKRKVPPKGKEEDKTYQERYAIAQEFILGWRTCMDEFEDYQKKCDELGKLFEETTQKNKDAEVVVTLVFSRNVSDKESFSVDLNIYQDDITATENKIKEYRELLDKTALKLNRIRLARAPAYSKQAQQCSFTNWGSGNPEFDKIIGDSQLSIKYPNGFIQWIPYEKLTNVEFVGRGAYANVYKANWVEGLGALKELKNSINIGKEFLEEAAYIKSSSCTVLRCHGISKNLKTKEYIMVFPYALGGNLRNYMKKRLNRINEKMLGRRSPTTKDPYQKIVFWLNEFNKSPLPDTIQQFITNESKSSDEAHDSNAEYARQSIKTQTIRDPNLEKLAAKIKKKSYKDTNPDDDGNKYEDGADEWNTIHVNDYQIDELDILRDFSGEKIASIVTNEIPQLNYEPPTPPTPSDGFDESIKKLHIIPLRKISIFNAFVGYMSKNQYSGNFIPSEQFYLILKSGLFYIMNQDPTFKNTKTQHYPYNISTLEFLSNKTRADTLTQEDLGEEENDIEKRKDQSEEIEMQNISDRLEIEINQIENW
ncbi:hypothetical protein Glove_43g67 [Diversispora epigaea]|uniref:Serine-threonine/tyrosine-protein kinase catalytic domain-containing protein n=1 Tax=Diversispora epigaea TaxID=1348612 RepID=A0A397JH05_9GLOM|nr:hypothetical protein Glove_43g67 [Diversispora epigaea]